MGGARTCACAPTSGRACVRPKKRSQPTLCSFIVFQKLCCSSETITNENPELRVPRKKLHLLSQVLEQNHPQSPLHLSWRDILSFFKFLRKKVYWLNKKLPAHFCLDWDCNLQKLCDKTSRFIQRVQEISFVKPGNFFLQKFEK